RGSRFEDCFGDGVQHLLAVRRRLDVANAFDLETGFRRPGGLTIAMVLTARREGRRHGPSKRNEPKAASEVVCHDTPTLLPTGVHSAEIMVAWKPARRIAQARPTEEIMPERSITIDGVQVPRFLYGTAWKEDQTEHLPALALQQGFRGIDTANQRRHYHE